MSPSDLPKHGHEKRKNRYPKTFVDDKATALQLAETVAKVQEDKSLQKVRKHHHQAQKSRSVGTQKKERTSKRKLEEVKASIAGDLARAKREKSKKRKESRNVKTETLDPRSPPRPTAAFTPARKRVTFG